MNIGELLGALVQAGMSPSSERRMRNSLGGSQGMDSLAEMLGGKNVGKTGGLQDTVTGMLGGRGSSAGGSISDALSGMFGEGKGRPGGGLPDALSEMLGHAGRAAGGNQNLALGGLGALVGALLGGGGKSLGGALGGGLMALLGAMAFSALKGRARQDPAVPLGLLTPQTEAQEKELEENSEIILRAMINATKADGVVDEDEINRIIGKLREAGVDEEAEHYVTAQMRHPMETETIIAAAAGRTELAAEIYAASLLAIEVDTPAERDYLDRLAAAMGLPPEVARNIEDMVGLQR